MAFVRAAGPCISMPQHTAMPEAARVFLLFQLASFSIISFLTQLYHFHTSR